MDGLRLRDLHRYYRALNERRGLAVLCVQENMRTAAATHTEVIARELGSSFAQVGDSDARMGIVYDRERAELVDHHLVPLPRLERLTWFQRLYIDGGKPSQKYAQLATFRPISGDLLTVFNFHLETAGAHEHRRRQVEAIARAAVEGDHQDRFVACGDTNAFELVPARQRGALDEILEPLERLGARDSGTDPTHFFARQNEPKPLHQMAVMLGRLGIDFPGRYDVVCTNVDVVDHGTVSTVESDHDLVWAELAG